jgi:hypothetical protein
LLKLDNSFIIDVFSKIILFSQIYILILLLNYQKLILTYSKRVLRIIERVEKQGERKREKEREREREREDQINLFIFKISI